MDPNSSSRADSSAFLERCNKTLEREKLLADNMEQPAEPPKNSADDTRTGKAYFQYSLAILTFLVSNAPSVSLKVADNSQPCKRKRQNIDHVIRKNKRLRNTRKLELFLT